MMEDEGVKNTYAEATRPMREHTPEIYLNDIEKTFRKTTETSIFCIFSLHAL